MNSLSSWLKTWSIPQALVAGIAMLCATALAITITVQDDWGKLMHWLSDPATSGLLISLVTLGGTLYHRALGLTPERPESPESADPPKPGPPAAVEDAGES